MSIEPLELGTHRIQLLEILLEVDGPFCFKLHHFSRGRMLKTQLGCVQRQSSDPTLVFDLRLSKGATILDVATDRVTKLGQMDPDLVGSTRFQPAFHFAVGSNFPQRLKMSDGLLAD